MGFATNMGPVIRYSTYGITDPIILDCFDCVAKVSLCQQFPWHINLAAFNTLPPIQRAIPKTKIQSNQANIRFEHISPYCTYQQFAQEPHFFKPSSEITPQNQKRLFVKSSCMNTLYNANVPMGFMLLNSLTGGVCFYNSITEKYTPQYCQDNKV